MSGETKSNGQKDPLDRFYTKESTVLKCLSILDLEKYDCIIEPSAGSGAFLKHIPQKYKIYSYDISPAKEEIVKADWLSLDKEVFSKYTNILVVGNPPFGQQNSLAIKFFNESASFCNEIAFILPLSFKKDSVQNKLNLFFHLKDEIILADASFCLADNEEDIEVPSVFQHWIKKDHKRKIRKVKRTSSLFDFVNKDFADFRIQRVGGKAGKASFDLDKSPQSNYFIKNNSNISNEEFVKIINNIKFPTIEYTVGPKSLSKAELVEEIELKVFSEDSS